MISRDILMYKTLTRILNVLTTVMLYQTAQHVPGLSQILRNLPYVCTVVTALNHYSPWIIISGNFFKVGKNTLNFQTTF